MRRLFLVAFAAATLSAQPKPLSKEEQILIRLAKIEEQNHRILKILEEADAPPPPIKVNVSGAPVLGMDKAPITVVEFTDMECPYCSKFHLETFPALREKFITNGLVRFVSRDLPLPMHKNAMQAAEAGRCAEEQGHFWEMRDWMQSNPTKLEITDLRGHAMDLGLEPDQFQSCMTAAKYKTSIDADMAEAKKLNITGTPAFVIGKSGPIVEGDLIVGAQPFAAFENAILKVSEKGILKASENTAK